MSGAEDLAKAAWQQDGQEAHEFNGARVMSVNDDGTVNLNYLGETHTNVEALHSYMERSIGDIVMVRSNGDHWTVVGKIGEAFKVIFPDPPVIPDPPVMPPSVTWGNTDPSPLTGWGTIVATWSHDDGRIYHKRGTITTTPPPPVVQPPPPTQPEPLPATTTYHPTTSKAYRGTDFLIGYFLDQPSGTTKRPQGYNTGGYSGLGSGIWATGWFYGPTIEDKIQAKKPSKVEVRFIRSSETHGSSGAVPLRLYLHIHETPPTDELILTEGPYTGPALKRGQEGWFQLPQAGIDYIYAGNSRGFAISSADDSDFLLTASGTGDVRITA